MQGTITICFWQEIMCGTLIFKWYWYDTDKEIRVNPYNGKPMYLTNFDITIK
jgi:hypothetical protein